jgi:hypothetical protein
MYSPASFSPSAPSTSASAGPRGDDSLLVGGNGEYRDRHDNSWMTLPTPLGDDQTSLLSESLYSI